MKTSSAFVYTLSFLRVWLTIYEKAFCSRRAWVTFKFLVGVFLGVSFCRFLFVSSSSRVSTSGPRRQTPREGTFFYWGGGGGRRRGGSLVNFLPIGEGQTCFILRKMTYLISFMVENIWLLTLHSTGIPSGKYKRFYRKHCCELL